tara:strand:+ start:176 stop:769 length:594 start_codon:yes stop_codon:yes gene_type:complete
VKIKIKTLQIILISISVILLIITYLYIPKIERDKLKEKTTQKSEKLEDTPVETENYFTNVVYEGSYQVKNPFVIKADKAKVLTDAPDLVYMDSMHVTITLTSGETVIITSDSGRYDKVNYNIFFENNCEATDGNIVLKSDNIDLVADEYAKIYNNVVLVDDSASYIKADLIKYDFESKKYEISMFENKNKIKVKLIN